MNSFHDRFMSTQIGNDAFENMLKPTDSTSQNIFTCCRHSRNNLWSLPSITYFMMITHLLSGVIVE